MKRKNPYQYKQPKKKKGEKLFNEALMKMYQTESKTKTKYAGKLTEETLDKIRTSLKRRNKYENTKDRSYT